MASLCGAALRAEASPLGGRLLSVEEIRDEAALLPRVRRRSLLQTQPRREFFRQTGAPDAGWVISA